jgi:hypothetical protein
MIWDPTRRARIFVVDSCSRDYSSLLSASRRGLAEVTFFANGRDALRANSALRSAAVRCNATQPMAELWRVCRGASGPGWETITTWKCRPSWRRVKPSPWAQLKAGTLGRWRGRYESTAKMGFITSPRGAGNAA